MITLDELQIAELEQDGYMIDKDEDGNVISVTNIVYPGPLIVGDAEYFRQLLEVKGIMRAMHESVEVIE